MLKKQFRFIPIIEAPWSRAAPVKLCTRCNRLSRDLAGEAGALTPRCGPLPKLNDKSGAFPAGWFGIRLGAGGGGIFGGPPGGPPVDCGCCCKGARCALAAAATAAGSFGSTSSHSEDKSPELNLMEKN